MWSDSIIRGDKRRARLLLYLPLALLLLVWGFLQVAYKSGIDMPWLDVEYEDLESVQLFREYLRIDTTYPDGNEIPGAEWLAQKLEAEGISVRLDRVGHRNANLWAVIEGRDPRPLVLHNHIDVEPILNPESWRFPPFDAEIHGPFVYGRGAFDMKSVTIAQLMAMVEFQRSGKTPSRSLAFLATGDEERDSRLGTRRWLAENPELAATFYGVLTEGGAVEAVNLEKVKFWGTEFLQKYFVDIWICSSSKEQLEALREEFLEASYGELRPPLPEIAKFFQAYAPSRQRPEIRQALLAADEVLETPDRFFLPPRLLASLRNEVVAFPIEEDPTGGYTLRVILHLLPDVTFEEGFAELIPGGLFGFTYTVDVQHPPVQASPIDHPLFLGIDRFMEAQFPEIDHGPLLVPWSATDARFFRSLGIPAYGYSPFWILSSDAARMKGANERIPVPAFAAGVETYIDLVESLLE